MATYKAPVKSDEVTRIEYQCKYCSSWLNKWGFMDDKHRTTRGTYCPFCSTVEKRREQDKENAKILKEKNGK
jgi:hypothetical protein